MGKEVKRTGAVPEAGEEARVSRENAVLLAINRVFGERTRCETEAELAGVCLATAEALTDSGFGFIGEVNADGRFDTIAISNPGWDACRMPESSAAMLITDMELRGTDLRILLIEDNPGHVRLIQEILGESETISFDLGGGSAGGPVQGVGVGFRSSH